MIPIKKQLADIDRELSKGHGEIPEDLLTALLSSLSAADFEDLNEHLIQVIHRFQPKRRKRLLSHMHAAAAKASARSPGGSGGTDGSMTGVSDADTARLIRDLSELEDGRVCSWEIPRFQDRVVDKTIAIALISDQVRIHRRAGDTLGAGEWSAAALPFIAARDLDRVVAEILAAWSAPRGSVSDFDSLSSLVENRAIFAEEDLATAIGHVSLRLQEQHLPYPALLSDLAFKIQEAIESVFGFDGVRKRELCPRAASAVLTARDALNTAVNSFRGTTPATAKEASIVLIRRAKATQQIALATERPLLSEVPLVVGTEFRKLCEDYHAHRTDGILRRTPALRGHATSLLARGDELGGARLWKDVIEPVAEKAVELAGDVLASTQQATAPDLALATAMFKIDLGRQGQEVVVAARLLNRGMGRAKDIQLTSSNPDPLVNLRIVEPAARFDIPGQSEQLVRIGVTVDADAESISVPIEWHFQTLTGLPGTVVEHIQLVQQIAQPDWEVLKADPPYSHNPVQVRNRLFGRDALLDDLALNAMARNSCFVWGQKRIGKTSVLQVLAAALRSRPDVACVFLRMGEIKGLHEGQLAHTIAVRLAAEFAFDGPAVPEEGHFGASMARLIPWLEALVSSRPEHRFILIIDEFDDLDPAYYTGERGEQFAKQLRSLSEVGLTFFLVGSERMGVIYHRHQNELNKWTNEHLDSIRSNADCQELVTRPVSGSIEFDEASVHEIVEYCSGNPFYMNLLCFALLQHCMREQKTYVGITDVAEAKGRLMRTSGETNFAHFWSDNPTLSDTDREELAAKSCLALTLITRSGGQFEHADDLLDAQRDLDLGASETLSRTDLDKLIAVLARRRVLKRAPQGAYTISLPILREWLEREADTVLLPKWRSFCARQAAAVTDADVERTHNRFSIPAFPVSEDDLLSVAQSLVYLNKQVDVAKLRSWLSQFDDEIRVELAFALLKRVAQQGYVSEGAYVQKVQMLIEAVREKRRTTGAGKWVEVRGRKDNLAITYVDGELKSGGTLARDLKARLSPGKIGKVTELGSWLQTHANKDALILIADDFAATGESLSKGLRALHTAQQEHLSPFTAEGRLLCYVLYALPEALDRLSAEFPNVEVRCMHCFGDEVRAVSPDAGIFEDESERRFADEMLMQLGRELYPRFPMGFGDMGLLVCFHNTIPNNSLPVLWSNGTVAEKPWKPLFSRP
jgi:hypothetical protein